MHYFPFKIGILSFKGTRKINNDITGSYCKEEYTVEYRPLAVPPREALAPATGR